MMIRTATTALGLALAVALVGTANADVVELRPFQNARVLDGEQTAGFDIERASIVRTPTRVEVVRHDSCLPDHPCFDETIVLADTEAVLVEVSYLDETWDEPDDETVKTIRFYFQPDLFAPTTLARLASADGSAKAQHELAEEIFRVHVTPFYRSVREIDRANSMLCGADDAYCTDQDEFVAYRSSRKLFKQLSITLLPGF